MAEEHCVYTVKILPHRSPSRREASNWQAWSWVFLALFCIVRVCVEPSSFDAMLFLVAKHGDHTRAKPIHRPLFPRVGWGWRLITSTREWPGKNFSRFWDFSCPTAKTDHIYRRLLQPRIDFRFSALSIEVRECTIKFKFSRKWISLASWP